VTIERKEEENAQSVNAALQCYTVKNSNTIPKEKTPINHPIAQQHREDIQHHPKH